MRSKCKKRVLFLIILILIIVVTIFITIAIHNKKEAQTYSGKTIRVIMDNNYPPYVFEDASGTLKGILVDQWNLWAVKTGARVEITAVDWADALAAMKSGEYDVIDTAFFNEERAQWLDYSEPYVEIEVPIYHDNNIGGINDLNSLKGFVVAVKAGDSCIAVLNENGITSITEYPSYESIIRAAEEGSIRVFVMDEPPALYYLYKNNLADQYSRGESIYSGSFHRAVKKGDSDTLALVEHGFSKITNEEIKSIHEKWFGKASGGVFFAYYLEYILIAVGSILFVISFILIWNDKLRKEVKKKTKELEQEKELLNITLQSIGDGVVATDVQGRIKLINNTARCLTGWQDEALNREFNEVICLIKEETGEPAVSPIQDVLESGKTMSLVNHTLLASKNGQKTFIDHSATPIIDQQGRLFGSVMVFRDISQEKAQKEKVDYMISHDNMTGLHNRWFIENKIHSIEKQPSDSIAIVMGDLNGLKLINDAFGHYAGDRLIMKAAEILKQNCRRNDIVARWGGDEFLILMQDVTADYVEAYIDRVNARCAQENDSTIRPSIALGYAIMEQGICSFEEALKEAEQWTYRRKLVSEKSFRNSIINALLSTLSAKSEETEEHAERLRFYCIKVGKELGISAKALDDISLLAMLHDIGKVGISDTILKKPGPLTEDEWMEMKKHPEIGFRIAQNNIDLAPIAECILYHHERWDGSGYPHGLKGEEIPILSRILAVVDAFDAMTNDRVYHKAISEKNAVQELLSKAGSQFDPLVAQAFVSVYSKRE